MWRLGGGSRRGGQAAVAERGIKEGNSYGEGDKEPDYQRIAHMLVPVEEEVEAKEAGGRGQNIPDDVAGKCGGDEDALVHIDNTCGERDRTRGGNGEGAHPKDPPPRAFVPLELFAGLDQARIIDAEKVAKASDDKAPDESTYPVRAPRGEGLAERG